MKLIILIGLVISCASPILSQKECEARNWHGLGLKDGSAGKDPHLQLEKYVKVCSEHNISVGDKAYLDAHKTGMKSFCTKKGLKDGQNGRDLDLLACSDHKSVYENNRNIGLKAYCTYQSGLTSASKGEPNRSYNCSTKTDFDKGYQQGILAYCIPSKAFYAAVEGKSFNTSLCTKNGAKVTTAFQRGKELHSINTDIESLNKKIDRLRDKRYDKDSSSSERLQAKKDYEKAQSELNQLNMKKMYIQGMANSF